MIGGPDKRKKNDMTKLRITFSKNYAELPLRGEHNARIPDPDIDDTFMLEWDLMSNCSTTSKFISLMQETYRIEENGVKINYNFYPSVSPEQFMLMKKRMNFVVKKIAEIEGIPAADPSLKLKTDSTDIEIDKLNALHLYFEDVSNDPVITKREDYTAGDIYKYLEEINQLVHSMEDWKYQDWDEFFGTCRLAPRRGAMASELTVPLDAEDYKKFTCEAWYGDLMLDYFRVGKDLDACRSTNDTALVKNKGLAQQNTVHTCFSFQFHNFLDGTQTGWLGIDDWIKNNNLEKYYDFTAPEFTNGRVCLGKLNMQGKTREEITSEMIKATSILNVELA